jgi:hypothetical protein
MFRRGFFRSALALVVGLVVGHCETQGAESVNYGYRRGHSCPRCGRAVYIVAGQRRDGRHWHHCGPTWWFH